jgi:hypothetical protein
MDSLSPTLLAATSSRQLFQHGLIVIPTGGGANGESKGGGEDLRLELTDILINSDHITTSAGSKPTETLTLEVLGVKIQDVSSQNVNGGVTQQLPKTWNRVLNDTDQPTAAITARHR